jgi:hypothetical protein
LIRSLPRMGSHASWIATHGPRNLQSCLGSDADAVFDLPGDYPSTFSKYFFNILADFKPEEAPIRPEAAALTRNNAGRGGNNPVSDCLPLGIPSADIFTFAPFKIIQARGLIVVMYEVDRHA